MAILSASHAISTSPLHHGEHGPCWLLGPDQRLLSECNAGAGDWSVGTLRPVSASQLQGVIHDPISL